MGTLVLEMHPDPDNPGFTQKAYVYDREGDCIGYVYRQTTIKPNRLCFRFKKEYTIKRETLLSPAQIAFNESQLTE